MTRKICIILISVILCAAVLTGCGQREQRVTVFAMNTVMQLTVMTNDDELLGSCTELINKTENMLSVTREGSLTSELDSSGELRDAPEEFISLLSDCIAYSEMTDGAFDITAYPIVRAWGFTTGEHRVPGEDEIADAVSKTGYGNIVIDGGSVLLANGAEIDFGGIAKGYLGDRIRERLISAGVRSALIDLGGNITVIGKNGFSDWVIGIGTPSRFEEGLVGTLKVHDTSVVTSGSYRRYFEENGKIYGHIMDPATGSPAESGLASVTIVSQNTELADALSTGLYVMGLDGAVRVWREQGSFEAVFVTDDGTVYITEGLAKCFTLNKDYTENLVIVEKNG